MALYKSDIVIVGNKTNLLAVGLFRRDKTEVFRHLPHIGFAVEITERKKKVRKLFLGQVIESIGLILCVRACAL